MCTIIGLVITGCLAAVQSPTTAVKVLTSSVRPYEAPPPMADPYLRIMSTRAPSPSPYWPFTFPSTPIRPLSRPWSVTTYVGRNYLQTWFNGEPLQGPYPRYRKAGR